MRSGGTERRPIHRLAVGAGMGGHEDHAVGMLAVRQRHAERCHGGEAGGDAVDDLDHDALRTQPLGLFAAAAEDERVAALEAHHVLAVQRLGREQLVDEGLGRAPAAAALADVHDARGGRGERKHRVADQVVDQQHGGATDRAHRLERQQLRVPGAGADQRDGAGAGAWTSADPHAVCSFGAARPIAPSAPIRHSTWLPSGPGAGFSPLTTDWM